MRHLPDWRAQYVCKMLIAFCRCFLLTDQFFDLTGTSEHDYRVSEQDTHCPPDYANGKEWEFEVPAKFLN